MGALLFPEDMAADELFDACLAIAPVGDFQTRTREAALDAIARILRAAARAGSLGETDRVTLPAEAAAREVNRIVETVQGFVPRVHNVPQFRADLIGRANAALTENVIHSLVRPSLSNSTPELARV